MMQMKYCKRCVYPVVGVNLLIDNDGICSACKVFDKARSISDDMWKKKKEKFSSIISENKKINTSNYDCVIPVSGGKDSYFQAHIITKEFNLKPLLVTYNGNNYLPEGEKNRDKMKEVFDADHIMWGPSVEVLKKLNRIAFKKMGDMNWQNHCGIFTSPIIVAAKFGIPLIIWGETLWDISGMFDPEDMVEFTAKARHEHMIRGFEWYDFLNDPDNPLEEKDLLWAKYPSDAEILKAGVRGLYVGNFFRWDPNKHVKLVMEKYGWTPSAKSFERTYRKFSNLDDRYENGVHDLMKFIKFGYGRCSDHAAKDIRDGYISRKEGINYVKKLDHVVSSDLQHWLDYVKMDVSEFWKIADTFRDPRVWWIADNKWYKQNVWGESQSYGDVRLNKDQIDRFNIRQKAIQNQIKKY